MGSLPKVDHCSGTNGTNNSKTLLDCLPLFILGLCTV